MCSVGMAAISVCPSSSMMDERVSISVHGLAPHGLVTIRSQLREISKRFHAWAYFMADEEGRVSLDCQPSLGGTYQGVDPMGLFWSLQNSPGQRLGLRFAKKYPNKPVVVLLSLHTGHLRETLLTTDEPVHMAVVHKWYMREAQVERTKLLGHQVVRGVIYKPKGRGPFPGILDMFGTTGGLMESRAALLASHGYATYALPMFAFEDLSASILNIDLEYFEEALKWFVSQPYILPGGIGIVASSMGGSVGLHLAIQLPQLIKAVACFSCPPFMPNITLNYKGKALPFVWFDTEKTVFDERGVLHPLTGWPPVHEIKDEELIELEKIQCPVIFFGGTADECVPTRECIMDALRRRGIAGRPNIQTVFYKDAGHIIEPPYAPICTYAYINAMDIVMKLGGRKKEHAHAQSDAWQKLLEFLRKHHSGGPEDSFKPSKDTASKL